MALSNDVLSKFVKVTTNKPAKKTESFVTGTAVEYDGRMFVRIDGSDRLTPVSSSASIEDGNRVTVMIKNHEATVTGNTSDPSASSGTVGKLDTKVEDASKQITEFEILVADRLTVQDLEAVNGYFERIKATLGQYTNLEAVVAEIETLQTKYAEMEYITATDVKAINAEIDKIKGNFADFTHISADDIDAIFGEFDSLKAYNADFTYVSAEKLQAIQADIVDLNVNKANITQLEAYKGRIEDLEATRLKADDAVIKNLQADVADIDTLIFGSASGTTIQTSFANAVIAQLGNAQIKSAMIDSLSASKITAGDILTNNVRVLSDDGKLLISDETIQISDDTRVRVQIGKDASNDYSINVWDVSGKLMFSKGGITDAAIKDAIIRDDMVSDTANIKASKLDISSLFTEINNSTETINSNKVLIDTDAGTLDVAFVKMESDINDISDDVKTQGTALSVVQGQISSKVWMEDIKETDLSELEGSIETLELQHSTLNQTVTGISATVGQHTTQISNKADISTVTAVTDRVTKVETDLSGFRTNVSETYATKTALSATDTKAGNAATAASNAATAASNAQSTANTAKTNAATAQSAAEAAQSTADTAKANAATAQTTANNAATAASNAQKAADDAQDDVDALVTRVATAETSINQNAEQIELRATKTELTTVSTATSNAQKAADDAQDTADGVATNLSNNYYTKTQTNAQIKASADAIVSTVESLEETLTSDYSTTTQMNSAIEQKANSITQTVSSTYATKTALSTTDTKAANAATAASNAQTTANTAKTNAATAQTTAETAQSTANTAKENAATAQSTANTAKNNAANAQTTANNAATAASNAQNAADAAQDTADDAANTASTAKSGVESLEPRVVATESSIIQLSDSITQFVRGANGSNLLQQDQNGLTYFDFSSFQAALDANTTGLGTANDIIGAWQKYCEDEKKENTTLTEFIKTMKGTLDAHGTTLEYVTIGTYKNPDTGNEEPCIELGETDSNFQLLITNTRIVFMDGSTETTYIKDNTLVTNNVEVKDDLRQDHIVDGVIQGRYVWSIRKNGNYGLAWTSIITDISKPDGPAYTNLVPTSTDTNGTVYNGTGYKDDTRLSSSGGVSSSAQTGSVTTGFIPFKNTDIIRIKGAIWLGATATYGGHWYINLYNSSKTFIDGGGVAEQTYSSDAGTQAQLSVVYDATTGVTTFQIINPSGGTGVFRSAAKNAAYFRLNAYGKGANLIVTVNQEIV